MTPQEFGIKVANGYTPFMGPQLEPFDTLTQGGIGQYGRHAYNSGAGHMHTEFGQHAALGGAGGAGLALVHELLRRKSDEEENQSLGRKALRYAGKGGVGLLAGAGAGALLRAVQSAKPA